MPTYEYECKSCHHEFDVFQNMSDDVLKRCPECKKDSLFRKIGTGAGIIFKGQGFYETDYRSSSYNNAAKKDSEKIPQKGSNSDNNKKSAASAGNSDKTNTKK